MMKKLLCTLVLSFLTIGFLQAQNTYGNVSGGSPLLPIITTTTSTTANTPTPAEGTDFGTVALGTTESRTYNFTTVLGGTYSVAAVNLTGDWVQQAPNPFSITGIGSFSDFTVDFTPTSSTPQSTIVELQVTDNSTFVTENYFFEIIGTGGAAAPILEVRGDDNILVTATTSPGDNTDFGDVVVTDSITRSYTVKNIGSAPLDITNIARVTGSADFEIVTPLPVTLPKTLVVNESFTFQIKFKPTAAVTRNALIAIFNTDANFGYQVSGNGIAAEPDMDVIGNSTSIASGSISPNAGDDTLYPDTEISGGSVAHTFTIKNNGTANLLLTNTPIVNILGVNAADFTVTTIPSTTTITPTNTTTFIVTFDPTGALLTTRSAIVSIANNDLDNDPYTFVISGTAIDTSADSPLLITQYYDGLSNNQWIEVKNISSNDVAGGAFNLCLYTNTSARDGIINTTAPQQSVAIVGAAGVIIPGEVILFKNPAATVPSAGNLGPAHVISTAVATFTGDDVILISTSVLNSCYNDRTDIVGVVGPAGGAPPVWGADRGFAKGCGTTLVPQLVFDNNNTNFIELTREEVINADSSSNIALGTYRTGSTDWTGASWSNGVADRTRDVVINGTYTAANGSFSACNLTVAGNLDFNNGTSNYVEVSNSLAISGTFTIGDQESLYSVNATVPGDPVSISGSITKFETTTQLTNADDYTYWSSPTAGENMTSVFAAPTYRQDRMYYWDQSIVNADGLGGSEVLGEWIAATGLSMIVGKGYISQGPVGVSNATATVSFSGSPNTGTYDLIGGNDVVFNNDANSGNDLNLIGNPYPSALDADLFIGQDDNNQSLSGTVWFWTHSTPNNGGSGEQYVNSDYAAYNLGGGTASVNGGATPDGTIGSGQGFMVQAISAANKKVSFEDEMRIKGDNTLFFRGTDTKKSAAVEKDRVWLNLESSTGGAFSQILVGFFENATDGIDYGYDGIRISENWVNLYSKIDTLKYGIQGLSSFSTDKQVPLALNTYIDDASVSFNISIDRFEGVLSDNDIYLVDNELNVTHDLKQGAYNFTLPSWGTYNDRFTLQFAKSTLGVDDLDLNNDFVVINEDNTLLVRSKSIVTELKMYDVTGRMLVNMLPNESEFRINTSSIRKGTVLILNTTFENGTEISKKAIKY